MKLDCSKVKPCDQCTHYTLEWMDEFTTNYICRRFQKKECSLIYKNHINYSGPRRDCRSERRVGLTLRERIFGENKDKCGEEGRFWEKE